jgi:mRNA interferase RelE/StbE
MEFQVLVTRKSEKALDDLPSAYRTKIVRTLQGIRTDPYLGKKLSGTKKGQYSVRVWPYRIIYRIEKKQLIIIVIDIDHRQSVYK